MAATAHVAPTEARPLDDRLMIACGLAWAAGLLHAVAAAEHVGRHPAISVLALALCAGLFGWTAVLYRAPTRAVLGVGAALALAALVLWAVADPAKGAATGPLAGTVFFCQLFPGGLPVTSAQWSASVMSTLVTIADADLLVLITVLGLSAGGAVSRGPARLASLTLTTGAALLVLVSGLALTMAGGMPMGS